MTSRETRVTEKRVESRLDTVNAHFRSLRSTRVSEALGIAALGSISTVL